MSVNKVLNRILAQDNVGDVFIIDPATAVRMELEESKNSGPGCRYENRALNESRGMDLKVCVFSKGFLEAPTDMLTVIENEQGDVCGHDVSCGMSREMIRDGAVWVGSSYVLYPDVDIQSKPKFVVLPHRLSFLGENEGVSDSIAYNPSRASDVFLRQRFGYEDKDFSTSTIIAVDFSD